MKLSIHRLSFLFLFLFTMLGIQQIDAQGNNFIIISGKGVDDGNKDPIPGVNIRIKGTVNYYPAITLDGLLNK